MGYDPRGCKESDATEATEHAHTSLLESFLEIICIEFIILGHSFGEPN